MLVCRVAVAGAVATTVGAATIVVSVTTDVTATNVFAAPT